MTQGVAAAANQIVMGPAFWIATVIFITAYALIIQDKIHVSMAEWGSLFFFIGLFIIIGAVVKVGLIKWMSIKVLELTHRNILGTSMIVLWFSAFASALLPTSSSSVWRRRWGIPYPSGSLCSMVCP